MKKTFTQSAQREYNAENANEFGGVSLCVEFLRGLCEKKMHFTQSAQREYNAKRANEFGGKPLRGISSRPLREKNAFHEKCAEGMQRKERKRMWLNCSRDLLREICVEEMHFTQSAQREYNAENAKGFG